MPQQLRSRRSRPNYAALHTGEDAEVYDPDPEELESGSEFAANDSDADGGAQDDDAVEPNAEGSEDESGDEAGPSSKATPQVKKSKAKSQGPTSRPRKSVPAGLSKPSKSILPTTHHRHRPPPLFRRDAQVERLLDSPTLFQHSATVLTNSFTSSARTTKRLERSWSRNVGPGPVHEILEDRAWFKEAAPTAAVASEAGRRPVVYDAVKLDGKYRIISERSVPWTSIFLSR
jgi:transcription factor C subunit 6